MHSETLAQPREHLPRGEDFLLWPPCLQSYGYRIVDRLFATRTIERGAHATPLRRGWEIQPVYESYGEKRSVADFMDRNSVAGLIVMRDGAVLLERYGLGLAAEDRWSTMSMVKSLTSLLVGAAVRDGAIGAVDDGVQRYLPQMRGCAYEGVSIRHLLTMSSGVRWSEDYTNRASDVNRYSKSLADKVPGGVMAILRGLARAHEPGSVWNYNTADTYLLGAAVTAATGVPLAAYMSEKIWKPCGMEFNGYYALESEGGQEIGGSRAGMALRDIARIAQFVLADGVAAGRRVLPEGWIDQASRCAFAVPTAFGGLHRKTLGLSGYGFSWWLTEDGAMWAMGHSGQRTYINRAERLAVVSLAAYPEPLYTPASEHNRDAELLALINSIRSAC